MENTKDEGMSLPAIIANSALGLTTIVAIGTFLHGEYQANKKIDDEVRWRFIQTYTDNSDLNSDNSYQAGRFKEEHDAFVHGRLPAKSKYVSREFLLERAQEGRKYRSSLGKR